MEKTCPHCSETFSPKRLDSIYCSRSCRQMAYVDRKMKTIIQSITGLAKHEKAEPVTNGTDFREPAEASPGKGKPSIEVSEETTTPYQSRFLDNLIEFTNERHQQSLLQICLDHEDLPSYSISVHLRCLVECLLIFSESKFTKVDDLMEVCNAFTYLIRSKRFAVLPDEYPYKDTILDLHNRLKQICLRVKDTEQIRFKLTQEDKIEMIAVRFELAKFVPKRYFKELDFERV